MKVTFIIPPVICHGEHPAERTSGCTRVVYPTPNLYELTVAALVREQGYATVAYKDFVYPSQTVTDFQTWIKQDQSDLYAIWTVNLSIKNDIAISRLIHELCPNTYVVFMGPGPTFYTEKCLPKGEKNFVVRGEPDITMACLVQALATQNSWKNIEGLSYREGSQIKNNPPRPLLKDLDVLPLPARDLLGDRIFRNPKLKCSPYTVVISSRNCPYHCIYCVPSSLTFAREIESRRNTGHKPPISFRSPQSIANELAVLHQQGYKAIGFMDDNFIWNEKRTAQICTALKKYKFVWGCQARVDAITERIARMLGESGCQYVDLGVESFNDEILKFIKKGITQAQIYEAIHLLKKYHVPVKLNILIGTSPLETKETIRDTLKRAKALKVDQVMFNIVSPFPGTEFYDMARKNGWIITGDYTPTDVQRHSILSYPHLSAQEMEKILFKSNLSYFLSPYFIISQLKRFKNWKEFAYAIKALKIKLFG